MGRALTDAVMRLTGLRTRTRSFWINVESKGQGDTDPPLGAAPDLTNLVRGTAKAD
jgi:hypothetical protein